MGFFTYLFECFKQAFELAQGWVGWVEIGSLLIFAIFKFKNRGKKTPKSWEDNVMKLSFWTFILVFVFGVLVWAPYTLYSEQKDKVSELKEQAVKTKEVYFVGDSVNASKMWLPLTRSQIEEWTKALAGIHVRYFRVQLSGSATEDLGRSIFQVVKAMDCDAHDMGSEFSETTGIVIRSNKTEKCVPIFIKLFEEAGYPVKWDDTAPGDDSAVFISIGEKP